MTIVQINNELAMVGQSDARFPGKQVTVCADWNEFYQRQAAIRGGG